MQDRRNTAKKPLMKECAGSKTPLRCRMTSEADSVLLGKPRRPTITGTVTKHCLQNSTQCQRHEELLHSMHGLIPSRPK